MPSANDLGTAAMQLLGACAAEETPQAADLATVFDRLNDMVDAFGTERLTIYAVTRTEKALTANTQTYTIGSGGDINIIRPNWIEGAGLLLDDTVSPESEIPIAVFSDQEWRRITQKDATSTTVMGIYFDHAFNSSTQRGTIYVYPIPTGSDLALILYTPTAVIQFAAQATNYLFPPAYRRMLVYNLAKEIYPLFPNPAVREDIYAIATESKAQVKRANFRPSELESDIWARGPRRSVVETG